MAWWELQLVKARFHSWQGATALYQTSSWTHPPHLWGEVPSGAPERFPHSNSPQTGLLGLPSDLKTAFSLGGQGGRGLGATRIKP